MLGFFRGRTVADRMPRGAGRAFELGDRPRDEARCRRLEERLRRPAPSARRSPASRSRRAAMPPGAAFARRGRRTPAARGAACGGASSARDRGRRGGSPRATPSAIMCSSTSTASWRMTRTLVRSAASRCGSAGCRRPGHAPRPREVRFGMRLRRSGRGLAHAGADLEDAAARRRRCPSRAAVRRTADP